MIIGHTRYGYIYIHINTSIITHKQPLMGFRHQKAIGFCSSILLWGKKTCSKPPTRNQVKQIFYTNDTQPGKD